MPPRVAAAATRHGHSHRRPPSLLLGRSPGGGAGSCPMAITPGDLPTSSPNAQAPSHALRLGNTPSQFLPPAPTMRSPTPLGCVGSSASFPTLPTLCAQHLNSPGTMCTFAPDNCPVVDTDGHLLAPCTFCGRYFQSGGLSIHKHSCFHRNTTSPQSPAYGVSLLRGRPSPVHPRSLPPAAQWCLDHGAIGDENSKAFFESYLLSFRYSSSSNGVPASVVRLVKPVFEELVGCVLSFRGRAIKGASAEAAWALFLFLPALSFAPRG
jgi:hypothetical protein